MALSDQDRKKLWARSGNVCSFIGCDEVLAQERKTDRLIGEEAHIKGERPGAARYDPNQSQSERNDYSNFILLCPTHHVTIDADPEEWTVEKLLQIKSDHERQIEDNRQFPDMLDDMRRLVQKYSGPDLNNDYDPTELVDQRDNVIVRVDASIEEGVNTELHLSKGQRIRFFARGLITFDGGSTFTTPEGVLCNEYGFPYMQKDKSDNFEHFMLGSESAYLTDENQLGRAGSLYGWIGEYTPENAFFIGAKRQLKVSKSGYLYLAINDAKGTFTDNDGEFRVEIRILE